MEEHQDLLVEDPLMIQMVDLVVELRDQNGEPLTEVVLVEHMEIQDLSGEIPPKQLTLEVVEEEQDLVDLMILLKLMVVMEQLYHGYYPHMGIVPTSPAAVAAAVMHQAPVDLVAVLQEEVHPLQILPLVVMLTLVVAVAVDQVVAQQSPAQLVDLVLSYFDIPFDK